MPSSEPLPIEKSFIELGTLVTGRELTAFFDRDAQMLYAWKQFPCFPKPVTRVGRYDYWLLRQVVTWHRWYFSPARLIAENVRVSDHVFQGTPCLDWLGHSTVAGYGVIVVDGKGIGAHRYLYDRWAGPVPDDYDVDHLCRRPPCVSPLHTEPVTHAENVRRGFAPGIIAAREQRCMKGHPRTSDNTYIRANGAAQCRVCARVLDKNRRDRKREQRSVAAAEGLLDAMYGAEIEQTIGLEIAQ